MKKPREEKRPIYQLLTRKLILGLLILSTPLVLIAYGNNTEEAIPKGENATLEVGKGGLEIMPNLQGSTFEVVEIEKEIEPEAFGIMTFAAPKGGPHFGDFVGGNGVTGNIYNNSTGDGKISYIEVAPRSSGVIPILDEKDNRYKIAIAGLTGWVDKKYIKLVTYDNAKANDFYEVKNGELRHNIATSGSSSNYYSVVVQGKAPSYLKTGTRYLSYDGHYFYPDSKNGLKDLIADYNASTTARPKSVNATTPYYNYFQFLPARSQSKLTASDLRAYLTGGGTSANSTFKSGLYETEKDFIQLGNYFGSNPTLTFVTGIHESGWGESYYAFARNNYFGHNAVDSNPNFASSYRSRTLGAKEHFARFLNWNYLDAGDTSSWLYNGGFVGNKKYGMNVQYASDPYWGEKIAAHYYNMDKRAGTKDYGMYSIGEIKASNTPAYKKTDVNSGSPYSQRAGMTIAITEELTVSGKKWYKFSSESMLDKNKNLEKWTSDRKKIEYPYIIKDNQLYVEADKVNIVYKGSTTPNIKQTQTKHKTTPRIDEKFVTYTALRDTKLYPDWSTEYSPILTVKKGDKIKGLKTDNGWIFNQYAYTSAMDYAGYVKLSDFTTDKLPDPKPEPLPQPGNIKYKVVADGGLRLRDKPVNGKEITMLPNGAEVKGGKPLNGWVYIEYNNYKGYASFDFLVEIKDSKPDPVPPTENLPKPGNTQYIVTSKEGLNLRDKPVNGKVITTLKYNEKVSGGKAVNGWIHVDNGKYKGYASSDFLQVVQDKPKPPTSKVKLGDINGDGKIDVVDMAMLQAHLKKTYTLKGNEAVAADINKDGKIDVVDMAMLQAHLKRTYTIEGW